MSKTHDLVVKTGEYEQNGETKARWQNVGAVIKTEKGSVILLERWFNPAGIVDDKGGENVLVRMMPADRERAPAAPSFSDSPF
jgi:hypothetical protein